MSFICGIMQFNENMMNEQLNTLNRMVEVGHYFLDEKVEFKTNCSKHVGTNCALAVSHAYYFSYKKVISMSETYIVSFAGRLASYNNDFFKKYSDHPSELFLHMIENKGIESIANILGDYSLAILDVSEKELYLYKSPFSTRNLLYYFKPYHSRVAWGTALSQIFELKETDKNITEEYIMKYLVHPNKSRTFSPYKNIYYVEQGQCISIKEDGIKSIFMKVPTLNNTHYSKAIASQTLYSLLSDSVRNNLQRTTDKTRIFLSGGIDSSAITYISDQLINNESIPTKLLLNHTQMDERSSELQYAMIVAKDINHQLEVVKSEEMTDIFLSLLEVGNNLPIYEPSNILFGGKINDAKNNAVSSLTGIGADHLLRGSEWGILNEFKNKKYISTIKSLKSKSKSNNMSFYRSLQTHIVKHLKNNPIDFGMKEYIKNGLLTERFSKKWLIDEQIKKSKIEDGFKIENFDEYLNLMMFDQYMLPDSYHFLDNRHPFLDFKLIEFCLSVPTKIKRNKILLKESLDGLVNPKILNRGIYSGDHSSSFIRLLRKKSSMLSSVLQNSKLVNLDIIDFDVYKNMIGQYQYGTISHWSDFDKIVELDIWLILRNVTTLK